MDEPDLVTAIQLRVGLRSPAEARKLLEGVLQALAYVIPGEVSDAVCACIPEDAVWCLRCGPSVPDSLVDSEVFLGWIVSSVETTGGGPDHTLDGEESLASGAGEEARVRVRAVLDELWERLDESARPAFSACLPSGVAAQSVHGGAGTGQGVAP